MFFMIQISHVHSRRTPRRLSAAAAFLPTSAALPVPRRGGVLPRPPAPHFLLHFVGGGVPDAPPTVRRILKSCHCEPVRTLVWQSVFPHAPHLRISPSPPAFHFSLSVFNLSPSPNAKARHLPRCRAFVFYQMECRKIILPRSLGRSRPPSAAPCG